MRVEICSSHENNEWSFDDGAELVAAREPSIGYVAFFSDVSHGATPVKSGHRHTSFILAMLNLSLGMALPQGISSCVRLNAHSVRRYSRTRSPSQTADL